MTNRLDAEASLYLRQHADNPVDWYPWGDEAFARAIELDRPLFVSVGYSACHWCHVMAHESFESERLAGLLNEHFVSVKVDREERPDVDAALMAAVVALTGHGGWPLSAFLLPDARLFYGGTYYPPAPRGGMPGFGEVLLSVARAWAERRGELIEFAEQLDHAMAAASDAAVGTRTAGVGTRTAGAPDSAAAVAPDSAAAAAPDSAPDSAGAAKAIGPQPQAAGMSAAESPDWLDHVAGRATAAEREWTARLQGSVKAILATEDRLHGGFGGAPKFPQSPTLRYLLASAARDGDAAVVGACVRALEAMATGGIHDHLAGGFHRYATDRDWVVPHFEKMLYDNAQLVAAYAEAYQLTGLDRFGQVASSTAEYLLRDLRVPGGAFAASSDADAPGGEGASFVWRPDEIRAVRDGNDGDLICAWYDVTEAGNFEGRTILTTRARLDDVAGRVGLSADDAGRTVSKARRDLLEARRARPQPVTDTKVVAVWNGLAIDGLTRAASALDRPEWADAAQEAATFVREAMWTDDRLARMWAADSAHGHGFLEDYAAMAGAALSIYEWTLDVGWCAWAVELLGSMLERFDDGSGPLRRSGREHGSLLRPDREMADSAEPSGNALAAGALLRAAAITGRNELEDRAREILASGARVMEAAPMAAGGLLRCASEGLGGWRSVSVVGPLDDGSTQSLLAAVRESFVPGASILHADLAAPAGLIAVTGPDHAPGGSTATICRGSVCGLPTADPRELTVALGLPRIDTAALPRVDIDPAWPEVRR